MYKKKDYVGALVSSLNKEEKRRFTLLFGKEKDSKEPPLYYDLYQAYENKESELSKIESAVQPSTITSAKRRLYNNILRTLRDLNEDSSTDTLIQNKLTNVELLYRHSLPEQGLLELHKAFKVARSYEKFGLMLQLLDWEKRLNLVLSHPSRPIMEIKAEERDILQKFAQQMDLEGIYAHIVSLKREMGYAKGKNREILEQATIASPLMPSEKDCLSNNALFYRHYIYAIYYWMIFEHHQAYAHSKKLIEFSNHNIQPNDYLSGIFQHITSSVCLRLFDDTLNGIVLAEAFMDEHKLQQSKPFSCIMFAYHANYKMIVLNYMGRREELQDFISVVERRLVAEGNSMPFDARQIILANLMVSYMGIGQLEHASKARERILQLKQKHSIRLDILTDTYLFQLFLLLQSGDYELIKPAAQAAVRFFRKNEDSQNVFNVEMPIALLLSKDHNFEDNKVRKAILSKCRETISTFIRNVTGELNFQEHYSRYLIWIDAIENGAQFYILANEWNLKKY
ncbi:MAG: hypothetical protein BGO31_12670 [Bacteroidetes bacterium 43-16]|nr:MAG: hypothetical protein BGO31_12670 [Bacteroidetes bacterium 43-16]